jgi:CRP-like cAMP-binding protein
VHIKKRKAGRSIMEEKFTISDEKLFKYSFHKAGTRIFNQGDSGTDIYILKKGAVTVTVDNQMVGLINTPDTIFGEMAHFLGITRTATIETIEDCEVIVIPGAQLSAHVMKQPTLGIQLLKMLSGRLANTTKYATRLEREVAGYRNELRSLQGLEEQKPPSFVDELVIHGFITETQLKECMAEQQRLKDSDKESSSLFKIIVEKDYMTEEQLTQYLELKQFQSQGTAATA